MCFLSITHGKSNWPTCRDNIEIAVFFKETMMVKIYHLAIFCDLFGMVKWPFQRLCDLQVGDAKVTLNHLAYLIWCTSWHGTNPWNWYRILSQKTVFGHNGFPLLRLKSVWWMFITSGLSSALWGGSFLVWWMVYIHIYIYLYKWRIFKYIIYCSRLCMFVSLTCIAKIIQYICPFLRRD